MTTRIIRRLADRLRRARKAAPPARTRPALEALEDRWAPAVFSVNSLADVLNPGPGVVTLRSAIQAANATPGDDVIRLTTPGTYKITLAGAGEDHNATGDFDILAGAGNLTIVNASGGRVVIDGGGHDRIFDINPTFDANNPNATAPFKVTLQGLTLQHGVAAPFGDGTMGGGAIRDTGNASLELDNCVVTNNRAAGAGGGILMQNTVNTPWALTLNNTVVSYNHAGDAGGGIDTIGSGKVFVSGSQLVGNTCVNQGAAIWLDTIDGASATLTLTGTLVSRNDAFAGPTGALGAAGNGAVTISSSTVSDNYSGSTGGGFGDENHLANVNILNSLFLNNTAATDGGGVQAGGPGTTVTITGSVFAGNTAGGNGGGLFASGGTVTITGTRFTDNTATNGGGIEDQAATLALSFSALDNNTAVGNANGDGGGGGGLDIEGNAGTATVAYSLFLDNSATNGTNGNGGAINQMIGTLTVTYSQFTGNYASNFGGGVAVEGGQITITAATFDHNRSGAGGGGLAATNTNVRLIDDTFFGNVTLGSGGAVYLPGSAVVTFLNDTITGNTAAVQGGGVALGGAVSAPDFIENTIIALNSAPTAPDLFVSSSVALTDQGGNLIGGNPRLGPLEDNGGPFVGAPSGQVVLLTEAVLPGSPAFGHGVTSGAPTTDERGFPTGTSPSIGAYQPQYGATATPNQVYVESLYETLLNRPADAGAAGWVALLNRGVSPVLVVQGIENSAEYRTNEVKALYRQYLHREADPFGLQLLVNFLQHGGTVQQAAEFLISTQEYFLLHGGTNSTFVEALYEDVLGRRAETYGTDVLSQALAGGASRFAVASLALTSPEYAADRAEALYLEYLGRGIDQGGVVTFEPLWQGGVSEDVVLSLILGSPEAYAKRA